VLVAWAVRVPTGLVVGACRMSLDHPQPTDPKSMIPSKRNDVVKLH
jgi:hypothetical protein